MIDIQALINEALEAGFTQAGELNCAELEFMPAVRDMCAADLCHSYGKNWTCPPGCGTVEEAAARASKYSKGLLVQTIGKLEDDFDWESIEATSKKHKKNFISFAAVMRARFPGMLPMGAGGCHLCETCTYPDAPCRHPELAMPSMEAYGLFVSKVCMQSGVPYNNGPQTITFTSCFLLE